MRLLLSEILPLRNTRDLGDYVESLPLPWRFGELNWFDLIRLSDTQFFVADHPMEVTDVRVDNVINDGWERKLVSDGEGRTWTIVEFSQAVPTNVAVAARGTGYRNPTTGEVIDNPGDVLEAVERMAGRDSNWSQLRSEASRDGLTVSGSIDSLKSVQAWIHEITGSVGAIWGQGVGRLYPVAAPEALIWRLDPWEIDELAVSASAEESADVLHVGYDWSQSERRPTRNISMSAKPIRFGGREVTLELKWLKKPRAAEIVTGRLLQRLACRRYKVSLVSNEVRIRPGNWLQLIANPLWPFGDGDPYVMVTSVVLRPHANYVEVQGEVMYTTPTTEVEAYSLALDASEAGPLDIIFKNGTLTITVRNNSLQPLSGALVALDGGAPKQTNNQGRVQFKTVRGNHVLVIQHPLFATQTLSLPL